MHLIILYFTIKTKLYCVVLFTFILNFDVRYADDLSIGHEVLMRENGQLKAVKVKEISNFIMQGNFQ